MAEGVSNTLRHSPPPMLPPASRGVISRDFCHWLHQESLCGGGRIWDRLRRVEFAQERTEPTLGCGIVQVNMWSGKHWVGLLTARQTFSRAEAKSGRNHGGWEGLSSCWRETVGDRDREAAFESWMGRGPILQSPCPPVNISPPETFPSWSTEATGLSSPDGPSGTWGTPGSWVC